MKVIRHFVGESSDDEDFLELVDTVAFPRKAKLFRERQDHFEKWSETEFIDRLRLSKCTVRFILQEIGEEISSKTNKNKAVSPEDKLLLTLKFYATGSILLVVGDFIGIHKSTAGKIVHKVSNVIASLRPRFVNMPETEEETKSVHRQFFNISKFPKCVGAIDCTHIKIQSPGGEEPELFRNKKGYFSFNVQVICDANLMIRNIVAHWPGSTHDSTIFNNSTIRQKFENGIMGNSLLVGDSVYANKLYLITPLSNPTTQEEHLFNESQIRTRNCVERYFGVWKRRFPILSLGIKLDYKKVEAIVVATAVLHNIACRMNDEEPAPYENLEVMEEEQNVELPPINDNNRANNQTRNSLINDYFSQLL